jgi:SAM-dependent methyltransferase
MVGINKAIGSEPRRWRRKPPGDRTPEPVRTWLPGQAMAPRARHRRALGKIDILGHGVDVSSELGKQVTVGGGRQQDRKEADPPGSHIKQGAPQLSPSRAPWGGSRFARCARARLVRHSENTVAGYAALPEVYEWLMPDAKLSPTGSVAAFADVVQLLPAKARVLDCSCGTGQLAVGLADLGLDVVASDASPGMVRRTRELAEQHQVSLRALHAQWSELLRHLDRSTFDLVMCVGNSLAHAEGAPGRLTALAAMSQLLRPGARLVLTSRTWELVRARGSRIDVRDRVIRRNGRDGVVIYSWQVEHLWEAEHHLEIAVAQLGPDGSIDICSERLSFWPFRYAELVQTLRTLGMEVEASTFNPEAEEYLVVARRA